MKTRVDVERARTMREQGMTLQEVGTEFGVSRERIRQLVGSPSLRTKACELCGQQFETRTISRRFCSPECVSASKRLRCDCGAEISPTATRCLACYLEEVKADTKQRRSRIAALWAEGASMVEIAAAIGTTSNALGGELVRMRREGWDLPLRRAKTHALPVTKQQARDQLIQAVRNGQLRRPARCEQCGLERAVDGHHIDYSRPLYVEWLCRSCHMAHHAAERKAA